MYCTVKNIRDASELLENETVLPEEKIIPWIDKAQGRIDAVLQSRYVVPLQPPVPQVIASIAQDMAAGFLIANVFSNQTGQEQLNLSNQFLRRADGDLAKVLTDKQLDGLPGIRLTAQPGADASPAIGSTTMRISPVEEIIRQW